MPRLPEPEAPNPEPPPPPPMRMQPLNRGHRGGAWKVAYADFVTALMALFIVLWMMNASNAVKQSVMGYFRDPRGWTRRLGGGPANGGEGMAVQQDQIQGLRDRIQAALQAMPDFQKLHDNVKLSATGEGLRIDLMESEQGMFFVQGSPHPTPAGDEMLRALAAELNRMPNQVVIEGHTDARPFRNAAPAKGYGNWELSVDRANAARKLLHTFGLNTAQVVEVRGFADQKLMNTADPADPKNRRISVVVKVRPEEAASASGH